MENPLITNTSIKAIFLKGISLKDINWVIIAGVAAFLFLQIPLSDYIVDDAFIHLTFAENLVENREFSFNTGEPTYGVTAPLWTLILWLLGMVFPVGSALIKTLSIIAGLLTIPAFYKLGCAFGLKKNVATAATLIWSVNVWLVRWSASGMEATLAVFLLMIAMKFHVERKENAGTWYSLAVLCRPEIAALLPILIFDYSWNKGFRCTIRVVTRIAVVLIPWFLLAFYEFGTLTPNPALVKAQTVIPGINELLIGLKRIALIYFGAHGLEILFIISVIFFMIKRKIAPSAKTVLLISLIIIWASFTPLIYLSRGIFISSRYLIISTPALLIGAFLAIQKFETGASWKFPRFCGIFLVILMISLQLFLTWKVTLPHVRAFKPTIASLSRISDYVRNNTPKEAVIAVGDIGVLGFTAERYILDLEGLVCPEMIPYRIGRHLDNLVLTERFQKVKKADYIIDKSQNAQRLNQLFGDRYKILMIEPIPGGLVDTADEQWYYTLYDIHDSVD